MDTDETYKWGKKETIMLLRRYSQRLAACCSSKVNPKKSTIWQQISKELQQHDFPVSPSQCHNKFKGLCRAFKNNYPSFEFHNEVERILALTEALDRKVAKTERNKNSATNIELRQIWSTSDSMKLIETYAYIEDQKYPKINSRREFFTQLADRLSEMGLEFTSAQVENKWKALIRSYRRRHSQGNPKTAIDIRLEKVVGEESLLDVVEDEKVEEIIFYSDVQTPPPAKESKFESVDIVLEENLEPEHLYEPEEESSTNPINEEDVLNEIIPSFEDRIIEFLEKEAKAKQKRHEERMALQREKLDLFRALIDRK